MGRGGDEVEIEQRIEEILKTGKPSPWDLAKYYVKSFTMPIDDVLAVCDLGVLAVKIWLFLFKWRDLQTTVEISNGVNAYRTNTYTALRKLEEAGYVRRVKRRWQLIYGVAIFIAFAILQLFKNYVVC